MTRHHKHDYAVSFADCQQLQLLRQKALKASMVLAVCLDMARDCTDHCRRLARLQRTRPNQQILEEIKSYTRKLRNVQRSTNSILQRSQGTAVLVRTPSQAYYTIIINIGCGLLRPVAKPFDSYPKF